ncbi:MAG: DUF2461 domain-containing protein [Deltaproteobacteria bacterium]|nr:DUF2461 domain-containing protein [Candidatus Zymogenaceae bacterium]
MSQIDSFSGFFDETLSFYRELKGHNKKEWFEDHKKEFERFVMEPGRAFVVDMGKRLREIAPGIIADPRVNRSLFRINRDTRFSKDKTPYKTHLALWFWEGAGKRMECSGFYFHLEPDLLMLGAGIYMFEKPALEEYRRSVVHPVYGPNLDDAIEALGGGVQGNGGCGLYPGARYKRVPRGYDPDHERAELLLNKGLTAGDDGPIPSELFTPVLLDYCMARYEKMLPLHRWLVEMTGRL